MAEAAAVIRRKKLQIECSDSDDSDHESGPTRKVLGVSVPAKKKMVRTKTLMDKKFNQYKVDITAES